MKIIIGLFKFVLPFPTLYFLEQKSLTPALQHEILSQIRSDSELSDSLSALDIAIGFLASTSSSPDVRISDYLHDTLSLPKDRGIKSIPKVSKVWLEKPY